ncbi:MAG: deoxyribodipyrimidine photo-lyase, partial [Arenicellales bacterium]
KKPVIVWLRQDQRLSDHPALAAAVASRRTVLPCYVLDTCNAHPWRPGSASRWWLHHSLTELGQRIREMGGDLMLKRGDPVGIITQLALETEAAAVYWSSAVEPYCRRDEMALASALEAHEIGSEGFAGNLLFAPEMVRNQSGAPFRVFTPFWKHCLANRSQMRTPTGTVSPQFTHDLPRGDDLNDWGLLPTRPDWAGGLAQTWQPGETAGQALLRDFAAKASRYSTHRNFPADDATSRLSPYLHFGNVSAAQAYAAVATSGQKVSQGAAAFQREIGWREFNAHLLVHFPELPEKPFRSEFADFPWRDKPELLAAWQTGRTGFPIVDAGMRQLWHTGWMHNRVRMVAASVLVKHLLIHWRHGETWFWDTLVDADLANNAAGWQWVAGCGADAAPYFRIFNPVLQGQKFDADGRYVRQWAPELAKLADRYLHTPWLAPAEVLADAGVKLGDNYPKPLIEPDVGRKQALAALETLKQSR